MWRITAIARVEMTRLFRSRIAFTVLLIVPLMQVLIFGYAIRPTGAVVRVVVAAENAKSAQSVAQSLARQPGIVIISSNLKSGGAEAAVRSGRALIGIEVPALRSFANPFAPRLPLRIIVDGSNPSLSAAAVPRIEATYWQELATRTNEQDTGPGLKIERLYNPQGRADWAFLPALIGVTVMISMVMLGTLSLAREREGGTWEALLSLPLRPIEVLAGKLLPYVLIGTFQGIMVLEAGHVVFDLPMRGNVLTLVALLPVFAAAHLVLGYAIAARAATQLAALQGAIAYYLPAMLLSGFLYPFESLPHWAQTLANIFPLTHFIRAAQGAVLRGDDAMAILRHGTPILSFLAAALMLASLAQMRRLD